MRDAGAQVCGLLRELVAIDTTNPPGNEELAAEFLAARLRPLGFAVKLQEVAPGRANLVAELAGAKPGPTLALSGHLDVVAADPAAWQSDPFALHRQGSRVVGRGVCDMKGGIAAMVVAAETLAPLRETLAGTLSLLFVADEELHTGGTLHYLESGARPDAVVIGEPTGMDVCVCHRGVTRSRVHIQGKSGHAGNPAAAQNPLYGAARFMLQAEGHNEALKERRHPMLPPPTLAATMVAGGEQSNSIPGTCTVTLDRRTLPGEDRAGLQAELEELAARAGVKAEREFFVEVPASEPLPGATLGETCASVLRGMGLPGTVRDFGACCDMFAFNRAGVHCVLVGPGNLAQAHTANEWCEVRQLELACEFYRRLALQYLGSGGGQTK